jgi:peptidoglycan hydrolase-like protein with peptidoglycan-binding domain
MRSAIHIRRWRQVGLSTLLCLAVHGFAIAQTPTEPAKPEQPAAAPVQQHHTSASAHKKSSHGKKTSRKRGQQVIDSTRAREIQTALIREHYMQGEPTGKWDAATQAAMQRYQADQGWQSKTTPDSRALIKLGLGPSHDHLLNPESAMTTTPTAPAAGGPDPKTGAKPAPADDNLPHQ